MDAHIGTGRPRFEEWRERIETAPDIEHLLSVLRGYLVTWTPEALSALPTDLAATAIPAREAIYARAFMASQAELAMKGEDPRHPALREMALALAAAATRLQALESYGSVAKVKAANVAATGIRGRPEPETRMKDRT